MTIAKSVLFAPEKIRVGYQSRHNSENGYLSYIIYYDEKNKLRKEVSFNNWIGKEKVPHDVINEEIKGFRIADSVKHNRYSFGESREKVRIFDPRGFEFEISISNFLFLLNHGNVNYLEYDQKCRYLWDNKGELFLLPVNSEAYKSAICKMDNKAKSQSKKVKLTDEDIGRAFTDTRTNEFIYIYLGKRKSFNPYMTHPTGKTIEDLLERAQFAYSAMMLSDIDENSIPDGMNYIKNYKGVIVKELNAHGWLYHTESEYLFIKCNIDGSSYEFNSMKSDKSIEVHTQKYDIDRQMAEKISQLNFLNMYEKEENIKIKTRDEFITNFNAGHSIFIEAKNSKKLIGLKKKVGQIICIYQFFDIKSMTYSFDLDRQLGLIKDYSKNAENNEKLKQLALNNDSCFIDQAFLDSENVYVKKITLKSNESKIL